jgi:hypothetical protein
LVTVPMAFVGSPGRAVNAYDCPSNVFVADFNGTRSQPAPAESRSGST